MLTDGIDGALLDAAGPQCRIVANFAVGFNNFDLQAATQRGVILTNTPGVLDEATATHAWALLLATARRITETDRYVRAGQWLGWGPLAFLGLDVDHKTLGIAGGGRIGSNFARKAAAFDMKIIATRASGKPSPDANVRLVSLQELAAQSDHLVLAAPIDATTRGLVGAEFLAAMKADAHIVNVARGAIIDGEALKAEFDRDRLWASIDVTEPEPLPDGHWLIGHPRARVTPHLSWSSPDTARRVLDRLSDNIRRLQAGEPLMGEVAR